ncbi:MAG: hypothetical protein CMJ89_14795 [Planctomycetes bacterium]|nr:hypothetical protein [Planctomycetota bacterium]
MPGHIGARTAGGLIWAGLFSVLALAFARGYTHEYFYNADAYDFAQMGRQLAEGEGFTTLQAFPRHLVFFEGRGLEDQAPWPNLYRYPLSVTAAGFFQLLIANPFVAAVVRSGVFFLAGLLVLGLLAARISGSRLIGVAIVAVLAADRELWQDAYSGMVDTQGTFFLALAALALLFAPRTARGGALIGGACAALYLTKTQFAGALPVAFVLLALEVKREARLRILVGFLAGAVVLLVPWMVHNLVHAGDPNFSFTTTRSLGFATTRVGSDFEMRIDAPMSVGGVISGYGAELWTKFRFALVQHLKQPIYQNPAYSVLAYLLLFGLLPRHRFPAGEKALLFVRFALGMVAMHVIAESLSYPTPRFAYPYRGLMLIGAVLLAEGLLRSFTSWTPALCRSVLALALSAVAALGLYFFAAEGLGPAPVAAPEVPVAELQALCSEEALIASDVSFALALDARRRSVRLPTYPDDLLTLDDEVRPIDFVYISRFVPLHSKRKEPRATLFATYAHYGTFLSEPGFLDRYRMLRSFPDGGRLYGKREVR